jgi:hypothetical protein
VQGIISYPSDVPYFGQANSLSQSTTLQVESLTHQGAQLSAKIKQPAANLSKTGSQKGYCEPL